MVTEDVISLELSIGCQFIGVILMLVLYGLACAQVMYYYYHYRHDKLYLRCLVAVLWVIETATVVLDSQVAHTVVISKHATRSLLSSPIPELSFIEFVLGATAVLVVQFFYLHGTWTLSNKRWYTKMTIAFMVLIALVSLAATIAFFVTDESAVKHGLSFGMYTDPQEPLEISLLALSACIVDVYITVALCWHLRERQRGLKRTHALLHRLTVYVVNRGILTAATQLLSFLTYIPFSKKIVYLWLTFHLPASKLYFNSMLATLNARRKLKETWIDDVKLSITSWPE